MFRAVFPLRPLLAAVILASLAVTPSAQSNDKPAGPRLHTLRPGEFVVQKQTIPIDVVFINTAP